MIDKILYRAPTPPAAAAQCQYDNLDWRGEERRVEGTGLGLVSLLITRSGAAWLSLQLWSSLVDLTVLDKSDHQESFYWASDCSG